MLPRFGRRSIATKHSGFSNNGIFFGSMLAPGNARAQTGTGGGHVNNARQCFPVLGREAVCGSRSLAAAEPAGKRHFQETPRLRIRSLSCKPERVGDRRYEVLSGPRLCPRSDRWSRGGDASARGSGGCSPVRGKGRPSGLVSPFFRRRKCLRRSSPGVRRPRHPTDRRRLPAHVL